MGVVPEFEPGRPESGYYVDLRPKAVSAAAPAEAAEHLRATDRSRANPVSIAQLGLGAWQLLADDPSWTEVVLAAAGWLAGSLDPDGGLSYHFAMPHTYVVRPPWRSAMAQGEAASLLVRAAAVAGDDRFARAASSVCLPLLEPASPLVAATAEGPVLQEYPTDPPAHVLNGWISALWGLYDVAEAYDDDRAADAFAAGAETLAALLPRYCALGSWSRYDLFPHPVVNVASPFYHRLHIDQLRAMSRLAPEPAFERFATLWATGAASLPVRSAALARKVAFRLVRPRSRRLGAQRRLR